MHGRVWSCACSGACAGQREANVDDEATHVRVKLMRERKGGGAYEGGGCSAREWGSFGGETRCYECARCAAREWGAQQESGGAHEGAQCAARVLGEDRDDGSIGTEDMGEDGLAATRV
jgi:hypothetical protein